MSMNVFLYLQKLNFIYTPDPVASLLDLIVPPFADISPKFLIN